MPDSSETPRIRFGPFQLDEKSGELWRGDGDQDPRLIDRLPPQATQLLSHLIASRPQVVTRSEIRQLLWPDVEVDFEQSLHSCVRKIRLALGDSASDPRYVETIPRRGYRFIGADSLDPTAEGNTAPGIEPYRRFPRAAVALAVGVLMVVIVASLRFGSGPPPARIAVMPIPESDIAGAVVRILTHQLASTAEIIGPTTTESYQGQPRGLRVLIAELDIDYVINARKSTAEPGPRLLMEIIRGRDGAHVWVSYLDEFPAGRDPAEVIAEAMAASL